MRERRPFLVNDIRAIEPDLSAKSLDFAHQLGTRALICVPVVYEKEPLGVLAVDNSTSKRPLRQSDMNLLLGLASQLATSIVNATHFEQVQESEKKYRELVETASSLILRVDAGGRVTFVNEFAQRLFDCREAELLGTEAAPFILGSGADGQRFERLIGAMSRDPMRPAVRESEHLAALGEDRSGSPGTTARSWTPAAASRSCCASATTSPSSSAPSRSARSCMPSCSGPRRWRPSGPWRAGWPTT